MKRASLYSRSRPRQTPQATVVVAKKTSFSLRGWLNKNRTPLLVAAPGVLALLLAGQIAYKVIPHELTQEDIDEAVAKSLETAPIPSQAAKAYDAVQGSIVRVRGFVDDPDGGEIVISTGTGVVILDNGTILTNIHVVADAQRIGLTFSEGMEADADIVGTQPQDDLAVLKAQAIPDDLQAATLQSTSGLQPGDHVTAVGFPFGIGPSVSSGVVSGLRREFRSPEGKRLLTNLIQFDA
ncbi:MAG: S1C family serine protease, partial [Burkholderiales bacterium]